MLGTSNNLKLEALSRDYEQDCMCEVRKKNEEYTVNFEHVYLVACGVLQWVGYVYIDFEILYFALKYTFCSNSKIFTGCVVLCNSVQC